MYIGIFIHNILEYTYLVQSHIQSQTTHYELNVYSRKDYTRLNNSLSEQVSGYCIRNWHKGIKIQRHFWRELHNKLNKPVGV